MISSQLSAQLEILGHPQLTDASETLEFAVSRSLVSTAPVGLFAVVQRGSDVNHEEVTATGRLNEVLEGLSRLGGGRGRSGDNGGTGSR